MLTITANLTLSSITPYVQSRHHDDPEMDGESKDAYERRTWRAKTTVQNIGGKDMIVIPPAALQGALVAACKYSKKQIQGQGKATWTAKFQAGLFIADSMSLGVTRDDAQCLEIYANADGVRGSGKRVTKLFPTVTKWTGKVQVTIIDPIITEDIFREIVEIAGMYVGVGMGRPQNSPVGNGRFKVDALEWIDARVKVKSAA